MKIIDGMVWCNEIEKWVTPEEFTNNCTRRAPLTYLGHQNEVPI